MHLLFTYSTHCILTLHTILYLLYIPYCTYSTYLLYILYVRMLTVYCNSIVRIGGGESETPRQEHREEWLAHQEIQKKILRAAARSAVVVRDGEGMLCIALYSGH
jgi:hypothetical protein